MRPGRILGSILLSLLLPSATLRAAEPTAGTAPLATQSAGRTASKAAFLFNLSRYIEWRDPQADHADAPVIFAVMEDDTLGPALKQMLESKGLRGQVLVIRDEAQVKAAREFFNVFSFPDRRSGSVDRVLRDLKGSRVLTVSEARDFLEQGGMVQVEMTGDALQFRVNEGSLASEGLKAGPAVLRLSGTTLTAPAGDPERMFEAWQRVFDRAQAIGGGLPVASGVEEDVSVLGRMRIALRWIALLAALIALGWVGRRFRKGRARRDRHG
jgi:hypothetical protein